MKLPSLKGLTDAVSHLKSTLAPNTAMKVIVRMDTSGRWSYCGSWAWRGDKGGPPRDGTFYWARVTLDSYSNCSVLARDLRDQLEKQIK